MKAAAIVVLLVIGVLLGILFYGLAFSETIQSCTQADGTVVYTNKDIKGCQALRLPELSIVPDRHAVMIPQVPALMVETPMVAQTQAIKSPLPGSVLAETCLLYRDWIRINERTMGGFEYNSVDDTKKRLMLTKIFGSGFSPYGCQ
jgi:hypothetical protein